jgi:hypothetical protein
VGDYVRVGETVTLIQIPGGSFNDSPHEYRDENAVWIPSLTQVIKLAGLSSFDGARQEDMDAAAERGTELHELVECYNREGDYDPNWLLPEIDGYFTGYLKFLADTHFVPDPAWVEKPLIATIAGMKVGMKLDMHGALGRYKSIIEIKACSSVQHSWSVQTACQELGVYGSNHVGRVRRFALQLFRDGRYKLHAHEDHQGDEAIAIAALRLVWWRLNHKQKLWEQLAA